MSAVAFASPIRPPPNPIHHYAPRWFATSLLYHCYHQANACSYEPLSIVAAESVIAGTIALAHLHKHIPTTKINLKLPTVTTLTHLATSFTPFTLPQTIMEPLATAVLLMSKTWISFLSLIPVTLAAPFTVPIALAHYMRVMCWYSLLKKYTLEQITLFTTTGSALLMAPIAAYYDLKLCPERWFFLMVSSVAGYMHLYYSLQLFTRFTPEFFTLLNSTKGLAYIGIAYVLMLVMPALGGG